MFQDLCTEEFFQGAFIYLIVEYIVWAIFWLSEVARFIWCKTTQEFLPKIWKQTFWVFQETLSKNGIEGIRLESL